MKISAVKVPVGEFLLRRVARDLLENFQADELPDCLVLLPSSRACSTLEQVLLDEAEGAALLLPRIMTLKQWIAGAMLEAGVGQDELPAPEIRPLILAPLLAARPWLHEYPASVPGLAAEFIDLFDQVRLERRDGLLLRGAGADNQGKLSGSGPDAEVILKDVERIREAWGLYRRAIPADGTDALVELAARREDGRWSPAAAAPLVCAAGFGVLTRTHALLLGAALAGGDRAQVYLPAAGSDLDRSFCATWGREDPVRGTGPFSPTARLEKNLREAGCLPPEETTRPAAPALVPDPVSTAPIVLEPCPDPETEARRVVDLVVRYLDQARDDPGTLAVATPDPRLAARILAMLQEAGLDADNTLGSPLGTLPAGLLARFILRAALTGLRSEPLLEVLTHPFVKVPVRQGSHELWTLRLERMFRRAEGPQTGLEGLGRRARERDQVVKDLFGKDDPGMEAFVGHVVAAFAPLLDHAGAGKSSWADHTAAVRHCWRALTGNRPPAGPSARQDEQALSGLWEMIEDHSDLLEPVTLAEFTAAVGRLLGSQLVAPHRPRNLPVLVTGLIEARLERYDHLILAGLREDVFPSVPPRQLLLTPGLAARLGLPGWRDHMGLEAELFLRLLHNGRRVTVTWPREEVGQPLLPSPLVSRLALALGQDVLGDPGPPAAAIPRWRPREPEAGKVMAAQERFDRDPEPTRALVPSRPQRLLSWSALRMWRECPYRFLLERRFALAREEDLRKEFSRLDYGSLVHGALQDFLTPGSGGAEALARTDRDGALAALDRAAAARFAPGAEELPVRRLWLDAFRRAMPAVVDAELERAGAWRPHLLESRFKLPLAGLIDWTHELCGNVEDGKDLQPALGWEEAGARAADILLRGTLDRLDIRRDDPREAAVLDYKTGTVPSPRKVQELEELQVILYAAATECGAVEAGLTGVQVVEGAYYQIGEERSGPPAKPHLEGGSPAGRTLLARGSVRLIDMSLAAADTEARYPVLSEEIRNMAKPMLPCRFCDLRGVCRIEEKDRQDLPPALWLALDRIIHQREGRF